MTDPTRALVTKPAKDRPSGPKGPFLLGALPAFRADQAGFLAENARTYGDIAFFRFVGLPTYQVSHPDDVRKVLVDPEGIFTKGDILEGFRPLVGKGILLSEGDAHKKKRRMMQPAFHHGRVRGYGAVMVEETARFCETLASDTELDLAEEMNRLTLAIAARTLFGSGITARESDDIAFALKAFAHWYHQSTHPLGRLLQLFPTEATVRFRDGKRRLTKVVNRLIAERRKSGEGDDILSMLVFAKDEEGEGARFTDEEIHDEAVTLLVAGHETTGATLAWAFHLLARNPEAYERLHREVDEALGDRLPTVDDLPKLAYAEGVFAEALRLYPSALTLPRQAKADVELAGYTVPKGSIVLCAAHCTHRDPRFYPEPDAFRPERWIETPRKERVKLSFFPFGGGARTCIGEAFAWMEGTLVLALLASRFHARERPGLEVVPEALFTQRPKGGLPMTLERRAR
jgi:cytochrome P450